MFKSRTMWAAGWVQSLAHVNLRAPEGWLCVEASPGDTSYPGLTKIVASTSTPGIGRNQCRGFVGRAVGRGQNSWNIRRENPDRLSIIATEISDVELAWARARYTGGRGPVGKKSADVAESVIWKTGTSPSHVKEKFRDW